MMYVSLRVPEPDASCTAYVCLNLTFFCFSLLPLKHLLLWRQSLLQELHVKLVLLLYLLLLPEAHLIAYVALEAEAQRDHWVANATEEDTRCTLISLLLGKRFLKKYRFDQRNVATEMHLSYQSFRSLYFSMATAQLHSIIQVNTAKSSWKLF